MDEQVRLRGLNLERLAGFEKEVEEIRNQVHDQASQLANAAELKGLAKNAKRELKKAQAQSSEALASLESSASHLEHLRGERNQREQRAKQYQEHYLQMREDLAKQIESLKIDKAERQSTQATLNE